jgi:ADP-dependent NAD(P)H-hydrate dehydratase / NAD(P)H-hydrate epimerase
MKTFNPEGIINLYKPPFDSSGEDNGTITIIGGSHLFSGAPLLAVKTASRFVDMVFFTSPDPSVGEVAAKIKSELFSFVWVPWDEVDEYVEKSDAVLIGNGFMRFRSEKVPHGERHHTCDEACQITKIITERLLTKFNYKKWVIDAGSLQTMDVNWIPKDAIITPNQKEFQILFGLEGTGENVESMSKKYDCVIALKGVETMVVSPDKSVLVHGGNAGLTKGGTGDVHAGLTIGLLAKNDPFLAASCASYIIKAAADRLFEKMGTNYNADDLSGSVPEVIKKIQNN